MDELSKRISALSPAKRKLLEKKLQARKGEGAPARLRPLGEADGPFPLSFAQERLWLLDQLDPGNPAFNVCSTAHLRGDVDLEAAGRCIKKIIERHEALRTVFSETESGPVQVVLPEPATTLNHIDLRHLPQEDRPAEIARLVETEARHRFDLRHGPLLRFALIQLGDGETQVIFNGHHICCDGTSLRLFMGELTALYAAEKGGVDAELPAPPIQYKDFAAWQRIYVETPRFREKLDYWVSQLAGPLPPLDLATDRPRTAARNSLGHRIGIDVPVSVHRALRDLGQAEGVTFFMTVLAAFQVLLHRLTGQDDIVVGTPVANRSRAELEGLMGYFVNVLPLRVTLSPELSFRRLLPRVCDVCLHAFENEEVPLEKIIEAVNPERDATGASLLRVTLNLVDSTESTIDLPGVRVKHETAVPGARFEITVYAVVNGDDLRLELAYDTDLFDEETGLELLDQLARLLEQIAAAPDERIGRYSLVPAAASRQLPGAAARLAPVWEGSVQDRVREHADRAPARIAITSPHGDLTYAELERRSNRLANELLAHGLEKGEIVAIHAAREASLPVAMLGVLKAGGAFSVLDSSYPAPALIDRLRSAAPRAWIHLAGSDAVPEELAEFLSTVDLRCEVALSHSGADLHEASDAHPGIPIGPTDRAYLAFTSGTTGHPRAIDGPHAPLAHFVGWQAQTFALGPDDRFTLLSGLAHDPLLRDIFTPLCTGAALCIPDPDILAEPGALVHWMAEERVSISHMTPAMERLRPRELRPEDPEAASALRYVFFAGEALTRGDVARLSEWAPRATSVNFYGATETPQAMAFHVVSPTEAAACDDPSLAGEILPLGRGIEGVELLVVNGAGRLGGVGERGEIYIRTPYLSSGYFGDEALTALRFVSNPVTGDAGDHCYRTGDFGRYRRDGTVAFCGRADDQVKIRGFRVELGEVEGALMGHSRVREAVVVLREAASSDGSLVGYLVLDDSEPLAPSEMSAFLAERLPDYMVPSAFILLDALPLTPNGKVDRRALPAPEAEVVLEEEHVAPQTPVEIELAGLWSEILDIDRIGSRDDFFGLGGHSLLATQLVSRIRKGFGVELSIRQFFEAPTIAGLAEVIEAARAGAAGPDLPPIVSVPRDGPVPLAYAQEGIWFLDQLDPGSTTYNMTGGVRLSGALDADALEHALGEIFRRHESLRTVVRAIDGNPTQIVQPHVGFKLPTLDRSGLIDGDRDAETRRLLASERSRPLDLEEGPLLRALLVSFGPSEHLLMLTTHHIVFDGWSIRILLAEVAALYQAHRAGAPSPLPELEVQYADFSIWQRNWLSGDVLQEQLSYWMDTLRGAPPALELPTDRSRPAVRTGRGTHRVFTMSEDFSERLRAFSREHQVTLFTTLLSGFQTLLHRLTGEEDVVVGVTSANRNRLETEALIGMFVNTLVLRTDLSGEPTFSEVLTRTAETAIGAFSHQEVPFDKVVEAIRPVRNLSRQPLFQIGFAVQATRVQRAEFDGLRVEPVDSEVEWAKNDLSFTLDDGARALIGTVEFSTELFEPETIDRFWNLYVRLLEAVLADPGRAIGTLPLLAESDRGDVIGAFPLSAEAAAPREASCVHQRFAAFAAFQPDAAAVIHADETMSYAELDAQANRLAHHLVARGVGRDDVVAVCIERSPALIATLLGVLKAGAGYLPIDPEAPAERRAFLLEDARARALVTRGDLTAAVPTIDLDADADAIAAERADAPDIDVGTGDLAYVIYTSGSTGVPKGVMIEHGSLDTYIASATASFEIRPDDRVLQFANAAFDASAEEIFGALTSGATLVMRTDAMLETAGDFLEACEAQGITIVDLPTAFWHELVAELGRRDLALPEALRLVIIGGERTLPDRLVAWLTRVGSSVRLVNTYGPTEATIVATQCELSRLSPREVGSEVPIGRPTGGARAYVLDAAMNPVPVGIPGELHIGGPGVARGYLGRPDLTAERFVADPFSDEPGARLYKTGDRVRFLPEGTLSYVGRIDAQVKIRGYRIEPGEVERTLLAHESVAQAAVVTHEAEPGRPQLAAYIVFADGVAADTETNPIAEVRRALRATLPDYMVPASFVALDELPRNPSGKVDTGALPAPGSDVSGAETYVAPRNPVEGAIARVWSDVLGIERIGVRDNFFELGGDSILSLRIVARARQSGLHVTTRQIFEHQTVAALARVADTAPVIETEQGEVSGPVALTPIQHWFFDRNLPEPHHWNQSILLTVREGEDPDSLRAAFRHLLQHHDALRMRFRRHDGQWSAHTAPWEGDVPWSVIDLAELPEAEHPAAIESAAADAQASLDLADGPMLRVVYFDAGAERPARLLCAAHHLVVDGVSWRLLLEDLLTAYGQIRLGREVVLPPKTTSFQEWSTKLTEFARSDALDAQIPYWLGARRSEIGELPNDFADGENLEGGARTVRVGLDEDESRAFLQEAQRAYSTRPDDLLMAALGLAWSDWTGRSAVQIDLESHGREDLLPSVDLSRTVGRFTTEYPVLVEIADPEDLAGCIKSVKEQLRTVPNHGIGYGLLKHLRVDEDLARRFAALPRSPLSFNYLGQVDPELPERAVVAPGDEPMGATRSPLGTRSHALEVDVLMSRGRLEFHWKYGERVHQRGTIETLARRVLDALRTLVAHCRAPEAGGFTPSDFPLAGLDQATLDRIVGEDRDIEDIYPLAPTQQGMFLHSLYATGSDAYFSQASGRLDGPLDLEALHSVLAAVIERHAPLRTSIVWEDLPEPLQVVHRRVALPLETHDLRDLAPEAQDARVAEIREADRRRGFALDEAPLLRCIVIRHGEDSNTLIISNHHVILDGWSEPVLAREILTLYAAYTSDEQPQLEAAPNYRDFIEWTLEQDLEEDQSFWRDQLQGFSEPTPLCPNPATGRERYDQRETHLPRALSQEIEAFSRRTGLTQNVLLQGAWALLIGHYASRDDVVFGVTVSGRSAGIADMDSRVGLHINTLPSRVQLSPDTAVLEWLRELQDQHTERLEYEHSPLPLTQAASDVPAGRSLFDSIVVFQNFPVAQVLGDAAEVVVRDGVGYERTSYSVTVVAKPGERFLLRIIFDADRTDVPAAERMLGHLRTILEAFVAEPEARLSEVPILTQAERSRALDTWSGWTISGEVPAQSVLEQFESHVAATPDAIAVEAGATSLSYGELDRRANQLGQHLRSHGARPGERVGIGLQRSPEMLVALLAVLKTGAAWVPLDPALPTERLAFMVRDADVGIVVMRTGQALPPDDRVSVICLDDDGVAIAARSDVRPDRDVAPTDLAYLIYTSGSTGQPKGVPVDHAALASFTAAANAVYEITRDDRILQFASLNFDASLEEIFTALTSGATLVLRTDEMLESADAFLRATHELALTVIDLPTAFWHELCAALSEATTGIASSVRLAIIGGEAAHAARVAEWQAHVGSRVRLLNTYGPTESTIVATTWDAGATPADPVPIGRPLPGVEAYVLDHWRRPLAEGFTGELHLSGAQLARGYHNRPELTQERFIAHPFRDDARLYRTGDLARNRSDGSLEWHGRTDQQVKIRGFRVEPGEVTNALLGHPAVAEAAVIDRELPGPGNVTNRCLVAYLVARETLPDPGELRASLARRIPEHMVPSAFVTVDALPRTRSGKLDRARLPDIDRTRPELADEYAPPRSDEERVLATVLAEVLGIDRIGIHDDFFALGGNSLLAVRFLTKLGRIYDVRMPMRAVFEGPTVAEMAEAVTALRRGDDLTTATLDLRADVSLDPEIGVEGLGASRAEDPGHVFLTGATGFLGAFLLRDLLETTKADIHCLVRAPDATAGRARLQSALEGFGLWKPAYDARIHGVLGNLAEKRLGLAPETFEALARRVDVIYHCGAAVNFLYPYRALKPANVLGTEEILRLATRDHLVPVHFVSTLSVLENSDDPRIFEDAELDRFGDPDGGYAQSKWVAEGLVAEARTRGVPVAVYRPGRIIGDSTTGAWNPADEAYRLAGGVLALGYIPDVPGDIFVDATPVDYVSRAIVHLSLQDESIGRAFHLYNPSPARVGDVLESVRTLGYPLDAVPAEHWLTEARRQLADAPENPLYPMLPLIEERAAREATAPTPSGVFEPDRSNTERGLAGTSIACPPVDAALVGVYLGWFAKRGLVAPPTAPTGDGG
jgi:amino acid adenylation domain-containing protein/thioester reductase-like protein/non-ribosomal peptide synthase protein (TIGR01720 family)